MNPKALLFGVAAVTLATTPVFAVEGERELEYPKTGVQVGKGWDTQKVEPTTASCIHFVTAQSQEGQDKSIDIKEVNDRSQLQTAMKISAEVTVKSIGFDVNGKASYARDTELNSTFSSFAVYAYVDNGFVTAMEVPSKLVKEYRDLEAKGALKPRVAAMSSGPTGPTPRVKSKPGAPAVAKARMAPAAEPTPAATISQATLPEQAAFKDSRNLSPEALGKLLQARLPKTGGAKIDIEKATQGKLRKPGQPPAQPAPKARTTGAAGAAPGTPAMAAASAGDPTDPLVQYPDAIVLKKEYIEMARTNPSKFKLACGDAFVYSIRQGAEITALVTFKTTERKDQEEISASMKGSGWGVTAEGSFANKMKSMESNSQLNITYHQTGGSGDPLPTNRDQISKALSALPASAKKAPYNYKITVLSYDRLINWGSNDIAVEVTPFDALAKEYGKWVTLFEDIGYVLSNTTASYVRGQQNAYLIERTGALRADLIAMQDKIQQKLDKIETRVAECTTKTTAGKTNNCTMPSGVVESDMDYRAKLPLPVKMPGGAVEMALSDAELRKDTADYWLGRINKNRCAFSKASSNCLTQGKLETLAKTIPLRDKAFALVGYVDKCLSVQDKTGSIRQYACDPAKKLGGAQVWRYDSTNKTLYLANKVEGKTQCLQAGTVKTGSAAISININACQGWSTQTWALEPVKGKNAVRIRSLHAILATWCVDVWKVSTAEGAEVILWQDCHGGDNQLWKIVAEN
jgi:hypothetical protein